MLLKHGLVRRIRQMVRFTRSELRHVSISILVLIIAVSGLGPRWLGWEEIGLRTASVAVPLTAGFILHEFSHKSMAARFGYWSVYRMWTPGLLIALVLGLISNGSLLFAAPGAVIILAPYASRRESGMIGVAGPLANVALAICLIPLALLGRPFGLIGSLGARVNLWLAFFNLLPIPPMDGIKVLLWNFRAWALTEGLTVVVMALVWLVLP
ncbi:MAG: site-2 protease family protein [Hadesarchaea archaeon]|nr:site-2 protease family protein [Hadesarchaea archaeon]